MENPIIDISSDVELFDSATTKKGAEKSYSLDGEITVTTSKPVIVDDNASANFSYFGEKSGATLTNPGLTNPYSKQNTLEKQLGLPSGSSSNKSVTTKTSTASTYADYIASQPSTQEQVDKAKKEGKFWDNVSKNWGKFKNSPGGQFALQQTLSYLQQRLANGQNQTTLPPPPPEVQEKDNTVWYILGAVAVIGILAFVLTRDKKPATA